MTDHANVGKELRRLKLRAEEINNSWDKRTARSEARIRQARIVEAYNVWKEFRERMVDGQKIGLVLPDGEEKANDLHDNILFRVMKDIYTQYLERQQWRPQDGWNSLREIVVPPCRPDIEQAVASEELVEYLDSVGWEKWDSIGKKLCEELKETHPKMKG